MEVVATDSKDYTPSAAEHVRDSAVFAVGGGLLAYLDQFLLEKAAHTEALNSGFYQVPGTYVSALINAFLYNGVRRYAIEKTSSHNLGVSTANVVVSLNVGLFTYAAQKIAGTTDPGLIAAKFAGLNVAASYGYEKLVLQKQLIRRTSDRVKKILNT